MKTLVLLAAAALLSGCTIVRYTNGTTTTTVFAPAFGSRALDSADLNSGKFNGLKSEQDRMTEAIAAGVAAGLKLKP